MGKTTIFNNIEKDDVKKMLSCFESRQIMYKKERTIFSNIGNSNILGIILSGKVDLIRYDYDGSRTIIDNLEENDIFGKIFSANLSNEISAVATTDCEILLIDYSKAINKCKKNCPHHTLFISNMLDMISEKIIIMNERIEILTQRTTREKLLSYFNLLAKKNVSRSFKLPFSYTDLADYLSIDRAAMSRELKYLKEDGFIKTNGRKIYLLD